jgi:hypothetical protein
MSVKVTIRKDGGEIFSMKKEIAGDGNPFSQLDSLVQEVREG